MIFYRLIKVQYATEAWSGYGARLYGGRWNHKGHPAIYVASSVSLAALEVLVHMTSEAILEEYALFSIEITDNDIALLASEFLPDDWCQYPAPLSTMDLGTGWLQSMEGAALILPSSIIPMENNAILNPLHPAFGRALKSVKKLPFIFDQRLIKG